MMWSEILCQYKSGEIVCRYQVVPSKRLKGERVLFGAFGWGLEKLKRHAADRGKNPKRDASHSV